MDKETLSNYGWIVICVLVLAVMIALATPFGTFISQAVKNTTAGLFGAEQGALGAAGIDIGDLAFACNHEYTTYSAKCDLCGKISEHTCTYDSNSLCAQCGEEKVYDFVLTRANKGVIGYTNSTTNLVIPATFIGDGNNGTVNGRKYKVTEINGNAFYQCDNLISVTIPDSVTSIGCGANYQGAFGECKNLETVIIGNGVTTIAEYAFAYTSKISTIVFGNSLTTIGKQAFCYNKIDELVIPNTITSIGANAFYGTNHIYYNGPATDTDRLSNGKWGATALN